MTIRRGAFCTLGVVLILLGCGGETAPPDGGLDASVPIEGSTVRLCASDTDCSDGDFCDGVERCLPGTAEASADGCVPGEAPCSPGETCDEATDLCTPDDCVDEDGDGFTTCGGDCDDTRDDINPSTEELCVPNDPTDEDCNPRTYGFVDIDGDGAADARCFNEDGDGTRYGGTDCDDNNASVSPLAAEVCDGRFDENCDGAVDEGCPCSPEGSARDCGPDLGLCMGAFQTCTATGWATCSVTPSAEVCEGSADENCDGVVDEGCDCVTGAMRSCGVGDCAGNQTCVDGSWDDCEAVIGPSAEVCDARDNDCDGTIDDVAGLDSTCGSNTGECSQGTFRCSGVAGMPDLVCGGPGHVASTAEVCDHLDNDCDGRRDEGVTVSSCTRSYPPGSGIGGANNYLCYTQSASALGCRGRLTSASGTEAFGAAYASWRGDWTRLGRYRATISAFRGMTVPGIATLSLIVTPIRGVGGLSGVLGASSGLPSLPPGTPAVAALILPRANVTEILVFEHVGTDWVRRPLTVTSTGCASVPRLLPTAQTYDLRMWGFAGRPRARVQVGSCFIEVNFALDNWYSDFYSESASYPRFYVGGIAYSPEGRVNAIMTNVEVRRVTSGVNANACDGC